MAAKACELCGAKLSRVGRIVFHAGKVRIDPYWKHKGKCDGNKVKKREPKRNR